MPNLEHEGPELGRIHRRNNDKKFFCHFTGFLEGIAASGFVEKGEVEPLIAECEEFIERVSDGDANDIIQDFEADLLEYDSLHAAVEIRLENIDETCEKSRLNRFLGYCRGIVCDDRILLTEAEGIIEFLDEHPELLQVVGIRQIYICCVDAVADGILDDLESLEICDAIGAVVGDCYGDTGIAQPTGVANFRETKLSGLEEALQEAVIVLTGSFKTKPRRLLEARLEECGASIARSVSGKTSHLIIGGDASRDWIEMNRGTKIRKAQELRLRSDRPYFVSESQLLRLMPD